MTWLRRARTGRSGGLPEDRALGEAQVPEVHFLIVGCMKCGTTTVRRVLAAHDDVHLPDHELHFFGNHERYLSAWDAGRLDAAQLRELYGRHYDTAKPVRGGKTPNYIVSSLTVERIQRFHPDARIVVMVRDPVSRAESHWNHLIRQARNGKVPAHVVAPTFAEHVAGDRRELAEAWRPDVEVRHTNVLYRGLYAPQIRRLQRFFPRERVFVGLMDDLRDAPERLFGELCAFLGVRFRPELLAASHETPAEGDGPRVRLTDGERRELAAWYAPSVAELEELLGRTLPGWPRG